MTPVTIQIILTSGTSFVQNLQKNYVRRGRLPVDAWKYGRVTFIDPEGVHREIFNGALVKVEEPIPVDAVRKTVVISDYPMALHCALVLSESYTRGTHEHLVASSLLARLLRVGNSPLTVPAERAHPMHFFEIAPIS